MHFCGEGSSKTHGFWENTGWQACTLVTLYCLDRLDYFYAGYSSLVLVAVFLIAGKIPAKYYT